MRNMKFYVNGLCHVALDGQKNLLIFRYIDLQKKGCPRSAKTQNSILMVSCRKALSSDSPKESKEIDPLRSAIAFILYFSNF